MIINVTIKPNSKKGNVLELKNDGTILAYVREIAADGKANEALVKLLAKHYKTAKTQITILRGHNSRHKVIEIK